MEYNTFFPPRKYLLSRLLLQFKYPVRNRNNGTATWKIIKKKPCKYIDNPSNDAFQKCEFNIKCCDIASGISHGSSGITNNIATERIKSKAGL